MKKEHHYKIRLDWTGNKGEGTSSYRSYSRNFEIRAFQKPVLAGTSDPAFLGEPERYNPEEMLVASLSSCHMLWYLHLCAEAEVVVINYTDTPVGIMIETTEGGGHFAEVVLRPEVTVKDPQMVTKAEELHHQANKLCFIANSCNFPVRHFPICTSKYAA